MEIDNIDSLESFSKTIKDFPCNIKDNYNVLKHKLSQLLKKCVGENIDCVIKAFPPTEFAHKTSGLKLPRLKGRFITRKVSVINGLLDIIVYIDPKTSKIVGFDNCYKSFDWKSFTVLPIGYDPQAMFA